MYKLSLDCKGPAALPCKGRLIVLLEARRQRLGNRDHERLMAAADEAPEIDSLAKKIMIGDPDPVSWASRHCKLWHRIVICSTRNNLSSAPRAWLLHRLLCLAPKVWQGCLLSVMHPSSPKAWPGLAGLHIPFLVGSHQLLQIHSQTRWGFYKDMSICRIIRSEEWQVRG